MLTNDVAIALADELALTRAAWSNMPDSPQLERVYAEQCEGYSPDEIRGAFRLARGTCGKFHPKPADIRTALAAVATRLRDEVRLNPESVEDNSYCKQCHTYHLFKRPPAGRLEPLHRSDCPLVHPSQDEWLNNGAEVLFSTPEEHRAFTWRAKVSAAIARDLEARMSAPTGGR